LTEDPSLQPDWCSQTVSLCVACMETNAPAPAPTPSPNPVVTAYFKKLLFISAISLTHKTFRTVLYGNIVLVAATSTVHILARSLGECPVCFVNCLNAFNLNPDEIILKRNKICTPSVTAIFLFYCFKCWHT
jgi:hypothetical protein